LITIDDSSETLREITKTFDVKKYQLEIYYALPNEVRCRLKLSSKNKKKDTLVNEVKEQINVFRILFREKPFEKKLILIKLKILFLFKKKQN